MPDRPAAPGHSARTDQSVTCGHDLSPRARRTPLPQHPQPDALRRSTSPPTSARSSPRRHRGPAAPPTSRGARRRMGAVGAGTVTATFYNFSHALVARLCPRVWESASPEAVLAARLRAVDTTLRRLLGEEAVASAGDGGGGGAGAERRRGVHPARPAAVRRPRRPARARRAAPRVLARRDAAARAPRRRPHSRPAPGRARPAGGAGQPHRQRSRHGAQVGPGHPWLHRERLGGGQDRLRERGLLDAEGELTEEGAACARSWRTAPTAWTALPTSTSARRAWPG